ncbi:GAF domain-containing sensor histidine kinase [Dactylosporangium sp. McL0621]|uniref:GAF domain-containing sensor histidine kinase n=1 Tax=Dactylosporangium sp. McL0621 TaxID=3415678 RepID=UPI003CEC5683
MTLPPAWSGWQLAEFLEVVSSFETPELAALGAVERAAEALDAEVAAILSAGRLVASVGYPIGHAPLFALRAVAYGTGRTLPVPGLGICPAVRVSLDHPADTKLVLARSGASLSREELSLLRGMARVASMTMRILSLLDDERAAREALQLLADEQAAQRRVATLVAQGVSQQKIFAAVAEEVGRLADADLAQVIRYEPEGLAVRVAVWGHQAARRQIGTRYTVNSHDVSGLVLHTGRPARVDRSARIALRPALAEHPAQVCSTVGIPIIVDGRLWGAVTTTTRRDRMLTDTEQRISGFTGLAATAISNAQARAELAASRTRAVVAADETRRRIGRNLHDGVQQQLASCALTLRAAGSLVPPGSDELAACLSRAATGLRESFQELQKMARGLHPTILSKRGLAPALRMLANRSTIPVKLELGFDVRLPEVVEVSGYYIASESLANAVKHAQASAVRISAHVSDGELRIEVCDDGIGGADQTLGSGLIGLRDRVAALGGEIYFVSPPGAGTSVTAAIPVHNR